MNRKGRLFCAALLAAQLALHAGALAPPVERAAAVCESGQLSAALLALELGDLRYPRSSSARTTRGPQARKTYPSPMPLPPKRRNQRSN